MPLELCPSKTLPCSTKNERNRLTPILYPDAPLPWTAVKNFCGSAGPTTWAWATTKQFESFLAEGLEQYGTHYGSSRNGSLRLSVYEDAEESLAAFVDAPAALAVSSGMWAGQLVMKVLDRLAAEFHYAPRVHPALWGRAYAPNSGAWHEWIRKTIHRIETSAAGTQHVVCTDSVGSPWVEAFRPAAPARLTRQSTRSGWWWTIRTDWGYWVRTGREYFLNYPKKTTSAPSLRPPSTRRWAYRAGVIFGDEDIMQGLRQTPWFAGSSPSAPAYFYALQTKPFL